jgi:large subunit ribosomal protein L23
MPLDLNHVIKRPMVTEKSTRESSIIRKKGELAGQALNRFSFVVDNRARKPEIRKAVEMLYGVRVVSVNTQVRKGQYFRTKFGLAKTGEWKKAVVQIHPDDRIELF